MSSFQSLITFSLIISISALGSLCLKTKAAPTYINHVCSNTTTFLPNSTYQSNLNHTLSFLTSNATRNSGYYNTSVGETPGTIVYGLFLCRGDFSTDVCKDCVETASKDLTQQYCTVEKIAVIWYDQCMLRYSNVSFFGKLDRNPTKARVNNGNVAEPERFNQLVGNTMNELVAEASDAPIGDKKFSAKQVNYSAFQQLYSLVQCKPDLSKSDCQLCLVQQVGFLPSCCSGKQGAKVYNPSCNIRYEVYPFYNTSAFPPTPSPESPSSPSKGKQNNTVRTVLISVFVPVVVVLILFAFICVYMRVRKAREKDEDRPLFKDAEEINMKAESLQYDFDTIKIATNDFSETNRLGQGGFGTVYRGRLSDGQDIAVKRLSRNSSQGDLEFKNEVLLLAKLQHRNLVRLFGFCLDGHEKLLVYEFVPNASLDHFIFDNTNRDQLDWERRYKIISGIAKGLVYLHEDSRLRIIHRDLKTSNILLDAEMNPKISDFGMAKLFVVDQTQGNTSRIVGTYGYMAPEYISQGHFSVKSDAFSFGVLILEILSGQKNTSFNQREEVDNLLSFVWRNWREGTAQNVIDQTIRNGSTSEILRCIHIALLCVQENAADRPTMSSVVLMLNSFSLDLTLPLRPAFFINTTSLYDSSLPSDFVLGTSASDQSKSKSVEMSINEDSISSLYPR